MGPPYRASEHRHKQRAAAGGMHMTDHVVDPRGSRTFVTISEALAAADPGDCVVIRSGVSHESFVVDKSVELVGQGDRRDIVIEAVGESVLRIMQTTSCIACLTRVTASSRGRFNFR